MRVGVLRHGIENSDLAKLRLGCLSEHSSGCQKGNTKPEQSFLLFSLPLYGGGPGCTRREGY